MSRLRERAQAHEPERHSSVWGWTLFGIVLILAVGPLVNNPELFGEYRHRILILTGINIILAVSLNVINGITGQFSIGHAGFMAIGAYVASAVTVFGGTALERALAGGQLDPAAPPLNLWLAEIGGQAPSFLVASRAQLWFFAALLGGGVAAALGGFLVGLPTLRLRGDYLAIATLGFSEIVRVLLTNLQIVGGASGFTGIEPYNNLPSYTTFQNTFLLALVCVLAVTTLKRSAHGRALMAVREDEVAAAAVGIDTTRYKVLAFVFSSFFAGVAGGLFAHFNGLIIPTNQMFGFLRSFDSIVMVVLGGSGSTTGAVLAAFVVTGLPEWLRGLADMRMVLIAEILLVLMLVRRQGLLGNRELTSRDWYGFFHLLATEGLAGLARRVWGWLRILGDGLIRRLRGPRGQVDALACVVLLVPLVDLLGAWVGGLRGGEVRTVAAELVSSLTALVPQLLNTNPGFAEVARQLHLPLRADLGLSLMLLPLLLPWCGLVWRLAEGGRVAARWLAAFGALLVWHGGGLAAVGSGLPRTATEAAVGALLLLWAGARAVRRPTDAGA